MHCAGFTSDTYDRYVLGLLEEPDRSNLEAQIQEQCPACLTGVQRSMNLWLVFAETLENAEPSEDFRGRIVRIAELSRKVLTFPKDSAVRERTSVPIATLVVICAIACILLVAAWFAGRASSRMDKPAASVDLEQLSRKAADEVKADLIPEKHKQPDPAPGSTTPVAPVHPKPEDQVAQAQAEAEHYKSEMARSQQRIKDTENLLNTLGRSGARLFPMKALEAAGKGAVGYVVFAEKSNLIFVGSNLPKPLQDGHTLQLWILRKEEPINVDAGVFTPSEKDPTVVYFNNDLSLLTDVVSVLVTDEPSEGKYDKPTGPKLFEVNMVEDQ
jgi:anti-sigma-K factor RskA